MPVNTRIYDQLETGDIILFSDTTFIFSRVIEWVTGTPFSHIGIVWKNPCIDGKYYKGLHIFESVGMSDIRDVENGQFKFGVQIRPLEKVVEEYNGRVWVRQLSCVRDDTFLENLSRVHSRVHGVTYDLDPRDWFRVLFDIDVGDTIKTNEMFCSALVAFVYDQLGLLKDRENVKWSLVRPCDFSSTYKNGRIAFNDDTCQMCVDTILKE